MKSNRIFLIGYMGSGKTTVGKALSDMTGFSFVDMDTEIEKIENTTIRTMFIKYGEHEFRNKEAELLDKLCQIDSMIDVLTGEKNHETKLLNKESKYAPFSKLSSSGVIISCGGGVILDGVNRTILKDQVTIFLEGNPTHLFERVKSDSNRPFAFMDGEDEKERLLKFIHLYEKRKDLYKEASTYTINIDNKSPERIAHDIMTKLALK